MRRLFTFAYAYCIVRLKSDKKQYGLSLEKKIDFDLERSVEVQTQLTVDLMA
jgi:hypothetical protein